MSLMFSVLMVVQVISAITTIILVLFQQGKGADMGSAFGSGSAGSLFGASGAANFLSRSTKWAAILFFASTAGLAYVSHHEAKHASIGAGVMQDYASQPAPASAVPRSPGATPSSAPAQAVPTPPPESTPHASSTLSSPSTSSSAPAQAVPTPPPASTPHASSTLPSSSTSSSAPAQVVPPSPPVSTPHASSTPSSELPAIPSTLPPASQSEASIPTVSASAPTEASASSTAPKHAALPNAKEKPTTPNSFEQ